MWCITISSLCVCACTCVCVCVCLCVCVCVCVVLEFELRKAQETIKSLRGSLTEATGQCFLQQTTPPYSMYILRVFLLVFSEVRPSKDKKRTSLVKSDVSQKRRNFSILIQHFSKLYSLFVSLDNSLSLLTCTYVCIYVCSLLHVSRTP